ncbi:hypothetical protein FHU14_002644 [Mesorhizobium sp. RMAD-H1]|nr:hypothetical protein [Mesorhizobium sp. RMAD-H1]
MESLGAPLWPAGHLPRKGGEWLTRPSVFTLQRLRLVPRVYEGVISPLAGEMPGRAEGGAVPPVVLHQNEKIAS